MTITPQTACTILEVHSRLPLTWCVYEVHLHDADTDTSRLVYINACQLKTVTQLIDLNRNTHWPKISKRGSYVYLKVIATGEKLECKNEAHRLLRTHNPLPECNALGYRNDTHTKGLLCSNGIEYPTQEAAAAAIGASQSSISMHMRGDLAHVKGFTFTYVR